MYEQYKQAFPSGLAKSTFYMLASILTHGEMVARSSIDYVTGFLLNDNFELLERIVRDILPGKFEDLSRKMAILKAWLKYGAIGQFEGNDDESESACARHLIKFELLEPAKNAAKLGKVFCKYCHGFDNLIRHIKQQLEEAGADACCLEAVSDCHEKLELFLGHRLRVLNQQRALRELFDKMRDYCVGNVATEALVVIDFKQNQFTTVKKQ
ncbi:hypothetical protein PC110_g22191 [Phytophthora cactorum]|uniref:Uncharacterized protein n=1 Tax=Phytophthora cactorum TaxID=29920 RepID=A0A329RC11_9STRA|nr:hypothetical protein PC110_g22191 [Phytophthora cactorum]